MIELLCFLSIFLLILSVLPFSKNQHWIFRVPEFLMLQITILQVIVFGISWFWAKGETLLFVLQIFQLGFIIYHVFTLIRFTKFYKNKDHRRPKHASELVRGIAVNVYQFNTQFQKLIDLITKEQPDFLITMESNSDWEKAMRVVEKDYPFSEKVTLENTYGMHFYSKLEILEVKTNYFVADDLPSIEAKLKTKDGYEFVFFGVHPPPPSPTEEKTSKERDGDLLSIAKKVKSHKIPVLVTGDFNNVAWAYSSQLFRKTSELIDARIGRGIFATFHAKHWFFRVPLDLLYHSKEIFVKEIFTYPSIGSDHFPLGFSFFIDRENDEQKEEIKTLENGEIHEVNQLIEEGKKEKSDNREEVATEDEI